MSEENGKVCCNCRHNIRTGEETNIKCHCDIDDSWLSYVTVMTHWCRHWSRDKAESDSQESIEKESIPYLMHKEMGIPLLECQKAYDIGIEYLRSQGKLKG